MQEVHFIENAQEASELLKPVRIDILSRLDQPRTCPELARALGLTTQKVNYHMNVLREAGLVELVEERKKRGTLEGVYRAVARSYWISPRLVKQGDDRLRTRDQASLAYLLHLAEDLQIDISHLLERAASERQPSLGVNARIRLRRPEDRTAFLEEIQEFFTRLSRKYGDPTDGEGETEAGAYRLMLACYTVTNHEPDNRSKKE